MRRFLIPVLMILVAIVSLATLLFVSVPEYTNTTNFTTILTTAMNPEILLDYSNTTVNCSGTVCFHHIIPFTYTETWSVGVTHTIPVLSTSTDYVRYATSELGGLSVILVLFVFLSGVTLLAREKLARADTLLKQGLLVEYAGFAWTIVEAAGAIVAGVFSGSLALLAFSADSIIELISSFAVIMHLKKISSAKANGDVSERMEQITAVLLVCLLPTIGLGTYYAYLTGVQPESSILGILIAIGAVVIMPVVWFEKNRIGKQSNCLPLRLDATESATCFLMSVALLVSLAVNFLWKLWWVDYVATLLILSLLARETMWIWRHFS